MNKVHFLKTNSGKKGEGMPVVRNPQFYFKEGFCWTLLLNEYSEYQKSRIKERTVNDVNAMALYPFSDCEKLLKYFISLINSYFIYHYKRNFISSNAAFQINDARQLPVKIPSETEINYFNNLFEEAFSIKQKQFSSAISEEKADELLEPIQKKLDKIVENLYSI